MTERPIEPREVIQDWPQWNVKEALAALGIEDPRDLVFREYEIR